MGDVVFQPDVIPGSLLIHGKPVMFDMFDCVCCIK